MDKKYYLYTVIGGYNRLISVEEHSFNLLITDLLDDGIEVKTVVSDRKDLGFTKTDLFVDDTKIGYYCTFYENKWFYSRSAV